jgi:hypothetical protein
MILLDQHSELDFLGASTLKQHSLLDMWIQLDTLSWHKTAKI